MSTGPNLLSTTTLFLRVLIGLNFLAGAIIAALFVASLISPEWLVKTLGFDAAVSMTGLRLMMLIGCPDVALGYLVLSQLKAMVESVRGGEPFIPENAHRLLVIAQAQLGMQLLDLPVWAVCRFFAINLHIDLFSWDGWLAVLLTFILARVFQAGTQMRADLEGTV